MPHVKPHMTYTHKEKVKSSTHRHTRLHYKCLTTRKSSRNNPLSHLISIFILEKGPKIMIRWNTNKHESSMYYTFTSQKLNEQMVDDQKGHPWKSKGEQKTHSYYSNHSSRVREFLQFSKMSYLNHTYFHPNSLSFQLLLNCYLSLKKRQPTNEIFSLKNCIFSFKLFISVHRPLFPRPTFCILTKDTV